MKWVSNFQHYTTRRQRQFIGISEGYAQSSLLMQSFRVIGNFWKKYRFRDLIGILKKNGNSECIFRSTLKVLYLCSVLYLSFIVIANFQKNTGFSGFYRYFEKISEIQIWFSKSMTKITGFLGKFLRYSEKKRIFPVHLDIYAQSSILLQSLRLIANYQKQRFSRFYRYFEIMSEILSPFLKSTL